MIFFFSKGIVILAGVVIGDAEYTSIVVFIQGSNSVVAIAETISFGVDYIDADNIRVVKYLDA